MNAPGGGQKGKEITVMLLSACRDQDGSRKSEARRETQGGAGSQAMPTGTHGRSRAKAHSETQKDKRGNRRERRSE